MARSNRNQRLRSFLTARTESPSKLGWSALDPAKPLSQVSGGVRLGRRRWGHHRHRWSAWSEALVLATELVILSQLWATLKEEAHAHLSESAASLLKKRPASMHVVEGKYVVPSADNVPLVLCDLSQKRYPRPQTSRHPHWQLSSCGPWISSKNRALPSHVVCLVC